jgi:antitoxin MazE
MQVSRWGNSLAVRLPAAVVEALGLKEGEEVEIHVVGARSLEVGRKPSNRQLPADFRFDRLEANDRG